MSRCQLWVLLALLAPHWARPGQLGQCHPGVLRVTWAGDTKCCPHCSWRAENPRPCAAAPDHECKCPEGFGCADENCLSCRRLARCEPGWEMERIGITTFTFECKRCENGTYSNSRNSRCRNWTDCESGGFLTLRAGNSTHNAVCGSGEPAREPAGISLEFGSSTILALLAAVAVFVLLLLTLLLHLCLWSLHRNPKFPAADLGQGEESPSIQFPEEEHGDQMTQEKIPMEKIPLEKLLSMEKIPTASLKIYSELR